MNVYITADKVGIETGGGKVTRHEVDAFKTLGPCAVLGRDEIQAGMTAPLADDPFWWDRQAQTALFPGVSFSDGSLGPEAKLAHCYAGCFTSTVAALKARGCKVTYTVDAHDVAVSKREHEALGLGFPYKHLTDPDLWKRYCGGYMNADVVICPGQAPAEVVRRQGYQGRIEIIPHGCDPPVELKPLPERFIVGYMGAVAGAADKGVVYLLLAWKQLNYDDCVLVLAGRDSTHPWVQSLVQAVGARNVRLAGWQDSVGDFYGRISLYVQPSMTEGWGLEVVEAMAHGRLAVCSDGAGAADAALVVFPAGNVAALAQTIDYYKTNRGRLFTLGEAARRVSLAYSWEHVRARYAQVWQSVTAKTVG